MRRPTFKYSQSTDYHQAGQKRRSSSIWPRRTKRSRKSKSGPLLYKIAIYHGSYPFRTSESDLLTYGQFLVFVGVSSRLKDDNFYTVYNANRTRSTRQKPRNRTCLLSQSLSSSLNNNEQPFLRTANGGEDLIDVLCSTQPKEEKWCSWIAMISSQKASSSRVLFQGPTCQM
ncbi:hypothetical protein B0O99DRAFT_619660 [Bisporella sp. PMI_857]|nr:hypothetical protein B0O99DRAFT_619660 [Bisporella sp. PMI_857]